SPKQHPSGDEERIFFEVCNLSLGGMLLSTEDPAARPIRPGWRLFINLQPRGGLKAEIPVYGHVCRVAEGINPDTNGLLQLLAIRFIHSVARDRRIFIELMKDIVERIARGIEEAPAQVSAS